MVNKAKEIKQVRQVCQKAIITPPMLPDEWGKKKGKKKTKAQKKKREGAT